MPSVIDKQNCIILDTTRKLNCEEKFLMIRLTHYYDEGEVISITDDQLSNLVQMSRKVLITIKKSLVEKGYLKVVLSRLERKGRPRHSIKITEKVNELWASKVANKHEVSKPLFHQDVINELLSYPGENQDGKILSSKWGIKPIGKNVSGHRVHLRPSSKLLLALLYAEADAKGVVNNLGVSDFNAILGMSRDRLMSQIASLLQKGCLLSRIPGVTSKTLLGLRHSIYILNLGWISLKNRCPPQMVFFL